MENNTLDNIVKTYLDKVNTGGSNYELEVRFGTRGVKRTTRINYDNVIQKLMSVGLYYKLPTNIVLK